MIETMKGKKFFTDYEKGYQQGREDGIEYVISGLYAKEKHKCPICLDCPKNCPVEMSRSNGK